MCKEFKSYHHVGRGRKCMSYYGGIMFGEKNAQVTIMFCGRTCTS